MALVYQDLTADEVIEELDLQPHPEGGAFRETFKSEERLTRKDGAERSAGTAIYFMLRGQQVSSWHKVVPDELWHFYMGAPLVLEIITPEGRWKQVELGVDLKNDMKPQTLVPAGSWQRAWSTGQWTLVGCTVTPGFEFDDFEMVEEDELAERFPKLKEQILRWPFE